MPASDILKDPDRHVPLWAYLGASVCQATQAWNAVLSVTTASSITFVQWLALVVGAGGAAFVAVIAYYAVPKPKNGHGDPPGTTDASPVVVTEPIVVKVEEPNTVPVVK